MPRALSIKVAKIFKTVTGGKQITTPPTRSAMLDMPSGTPVLTDVYEPQDNTDPKKAINIILFHGMNGWGNRDARLIHLSNCLASHGYRVIAPTFDIVTRYLFTVESVKDYAALIEKVRLDPSYCPSGRYAILTFSLSGPVALKAATQRDNQHDLSAFLTIGSPFSLKHIFTDVLTDNEYDQFTKLIVLKNVLYHDKACSPEVLEALRLQIHGDMDEEARNKLPLYLDSIDPADKQHFLQLMEDMKDTNAYYQAHKDTIDALDRDFHNAGDYKLLESALVFIHSKTDDIFHWNETVKLSKHLKEIGIKHKKLITNIFDHVDAKITFSKLLQAVHLYRALYFYMKKAETAPANA